MFKFCLYFVQFLYLSSRKLMLHVWLFTLRKIALLVVCFQVYNWQKKMSTCWILSTTKIIVYLIKILILCIPHNVAISCSNPYGNNIKFLLLLFVHIVVVYINYVNLWGKYYCVDALSLHNNTILIFSFCFYFNKI